MEMRLIRHSPRHFDHTFCRRLEYERDIAHCPSGEDGIVATCPECGCTMMYRGIARLRNETRVHHFECIHSYREVHSVSIVIPG